MRDLIGASDALNYYSSSDPLFRNIGGSALARLGVNDFNFLFIIFISHYFDFILL